MFTYHITNATFTAITTPRLAICFLTYRFLIYWLKKESANKWRAKNTKEGKNSCTRTYLSNLLVMLVLFKFWHIQYLLGTPVRQSSFWCMTLEEFKIDNSGQMKIKEIHTSQWFVTTRFSTICFPGAWWIMSMAKEML